MQNSSSNSNSNNNNNNKFDYYYNKYQKFLYLHTTPATEILHYQNYINTNNKNNKNNNNNNNNNKFICDVYILVKNNVSQNTNFLLEQTLLSLSKQVEKNFRIILVADNKDYIYNFNQPLNFQHQIILIKPEKNNEISWKDVADFIQQESNKAAFSIFINNGDLLTESALAILMEYNQQNQQNQQNENINLIYTDEVYIDYINNKNVDFLQIDFKQDFALDYFLEYPNYIGNSLFFNNDFLRQQINLDSIANFANNSNNNFVELVFNSLTYNNDINILHCAEVLLQKYLVKVNNDNENYKNYTNLIKNYFDKQEQNISVNISKNNNFYNLNFALNNNNSNNNSLLWIANAPKELLQCQRLIEREFLPILNVAQQQQNQQINVDISLVIVVNINEISAEATNFLTKISELNIPNLFILIQPENNTYIQAVDNIIRNNEAAYILLLDSYLSFNKQNENILQWLAITQRKNIGLVAPKIIDKNNNIIGNAMILGCTGFACGFAHGINNNDYINSANNAENYNENYNFAIQVQTLQNISSVSPLALMFSRKFYIENNGFNLQLNNIAAVIDLCLKTKQQNNLIRHLWNPKIQLLAQQINIAPIQEKEHNYLLKNYAKIIANDGFYNKNYSRNVPFEIKELANISRQHLIPTKHKKTLLAYPGDKTNCGKLRISYPANIAYEQGKINLETSDSMTQELRQNNVNNVNKGDQNININQYTTFDLVACNIDTMLIQRMYLVKPKYPYFENIKLASSKFKIVYDIDDLLAATPKNSPHYGENPLHTLQTTLNMFQYCHKLTVASPELANKYSQYHKNIVIIPNRLNEKEWKYLAEQKISQSNQISSEISNQNRKPRVGYTGSASHSVDTYLLENVIKETANQIDWIFFGQYPQNIRKYLAEYHDYVPLENYAEKLASLNLDLAVAPLDYNDFNACKSNLKVLEYGILGYPVIATDFGPYTNQEGCCKNFPITRVKNTQESWTNAILQHINDLENTKKLGQQLQQQVLNFGFIQQHIDLWVNEWFS